MLQVLGFSEKLLQSPPSQNFQELVLFVHSPKYEDNLCGMKESVSALAEMVLQGSGS